MGLHRSLVLAVAALVLPTAAANKKGIFGRMTRETLTNNDAAADAAANAINSAIGVAADSLSTGGVLDKAMEHFSETQWKMAERAFAGDMLGVLRDSMLTNKQHLEELTEAWSNPKVFNYLYDNTPFFKAIKPLRALKEGFEGQTGWTSEQVRADGWGMAGWGGVVQRTAWESWGVGRRARWSAPVGCGWGWSCRVPGLGYKGCVCDLARILRGPRNLDTTLTTQTTKPHAHA